MINGTEKIASWPKLNAIIHNGSAVDGCLEKKTLLRTGDPETFKNRFRRSKGARVSVDFEGTGTPRDTSRRTRRVKNFLDGPVVASLIDTTDKRALNLSAPCHIFVLPKAAHTYKVPETKTFEFTSDVRNAKIMPYGVP